MFRYWPIHPYTIRILTNKDKYQELNIPLLQIIPSGGGRSTPETLFGHVDFSLDPPLGVMGVFTTHRESGCPKKPRGNAKFHPCGCRGSKHYELTPPALRHFMLFTLRPHPTDCTIYLASLIQMETMARINSAWSNIYPYQAQRKVCYFPFCPLFLASIPVAPPSCGVVFVDSGERGAGQGVLLLAFPQS